MRGRAMRRLGSSFVTLWIAFFLPSAIIWGLMLRWSIGAAGRVETIWRWMADRLAFPLLLDRPIVVLARDRRWLALAGDGWVCVPHGTVGVDVCPALGHHRRLVGVADESWKTHIRVRHIERS